MPEISILMATYNPRPEYLKRCLESIKAQTFTDYELVLVDDATENLDIEEAVRNSRIPYTIIRNDYNLGLAKSLNRGLKVCRGRYIARMDDDDVMMPQRLEKQYALVKETEGIVFSSARLIDGFGNVVGHSEYIGDIRKFLLMSGNCLYHSSLMVSTELIQRTGYDERFIYAQDYALYMRWVDEYPFHVLREELIDYRLLSNTSSTMKRALSLVSCYAAFVEYVSRKKEASYKLIFLRRSLSVLKQLFGYAFMK